jgi:hypothetical protein
VQALVGMEWSFTWGAWGRGRHPRQEVFVAETSCALEGAKVCRQPPTYGSHTVEGGMNWSKPASGTGEER